MLESNQIIVKALPKQKKALKKGLINAVLYGPKIKSVDFCLNESEFSRIFKKARETQIIEIQLNGLRQEALIHDLQYHPLTGKVIHIDFYAFEKGKEVFVKVPVEFIGVSPAVKDHGGIFIASAREIEVKCLADKIPHKLTVDISRLVNIHDEISIKDLNFPEGVLPAQLPNSVIASIVPPRKEEEVKPATEAVVSAAGEASTAAQTTANVGQTNAKTSQDAGGASVKNQ